MEMTPRPTAEAKVSSWVEGSIDWDERVWARMEMQGLAFAAVVVQGR